MMYTTLLFAATAATASAQVVYNSTTGKFICPADKPDGAFCASSDGNGSLKTNIIIRCSGGFGQPGNCNDNLAGYFPFGVNYAPCWQTSQTTGDAACSKNCIVQGGSGKSNGTFTLPHCTPTPSPSSTSSTASSTASSTDSSTGYPTTVSTTVTSCSTSSGSSTTSTFSTVYTSTYTSTYCPPTTTSTSTYYPPTTTPTSTYYPPTTTSTYILPTGGSTTKSNATITTYTTPGGITSATATPVGPSGTTTAAPSTYTGAAVVNSAGAGLGLAAVGFFAAYFL